ncbi:MAG: glycosyltransferase family 4 protein [Ignavibacteriales bacterium]|nr:glycosyltransferase family 4 protein [Ignavibacteriales bacterium]
MAIQKINILFTSPFGNFVGGGQWSLYYLIKYIDKDRFEPFVILPEEGTFYDKLIKENVKVDILLYRKITQFNICKLIKLRRFLKKNNIQLIHTDDTTDTFYFGLVGKLLNIPVIWHIRVGERNIFLDKFLTKLADKLITVSKTLSLKFPWVMKSKIVTIYNGIDLKGDTEFRHNILSNYPIQNKIVVANIGRICDQKGQFELIKKIENINSKAVLIFIGENNTPEYHKINEYVRKHNIGDRIFFTGYLNDIQSIYNDIDILTVTSIYGEGFPRTIIESMSHSIPVISTDCIGASESISNNETGYIIKGNDFNLYVEKLNDLINLKNKRIEFGKNGYKRVKTYFDAEKMSKSVQLIYLQIIQNRL